MTGTTSAQRGEDDDDDDVHDDGTLIIPEGCMCVLPSTDQLMVLVKD
jgi:hypothetical protein